MKPVGVILALDNKGMMLANAAKQKNSAGLEQQAKSAPANAEQAERAEPVMYANMVKPVTYVYDMLTIFK